MVVARSKSLLPARLKTRQIVLLLQLDEKRSVLHAANAIGVTQPAASKLLGELEEALGVPLFERHARGVTPTWYGEVLVRHARAALSEIHHAEEEIAALKAGDAGRTAIGTVVTPGVGLVPIAVARLKQKHPRIFVRVEREHSDVLLARLLSGDLDIAVARLTDTVPATELDFEALGDEPQSVIVRAGHPLCRKRKLALPELAGYGWILPPAGTALRVELDAMFLSRGLEPPHNIVEATSLVVVLGLLQASDMLVSLPLLGVKPFCDSGLLAALPVQLDVRMGSFGIVTRRGRTLSPGAGTLLGVLRAVAKELHPAGATRPGAMPREKRTR